MVNTDLSDRLHINRLHINMCRQVLSHIVSALLNFIYLCCVLSIVVTVCMFHTCSVLYMGSFLSYIVGYRFDGDPEFLCF